MSVLEDRRRWMSMYGHMFLDDLRHGVMPIARRARRESSFQVSVGGSTGFAESDISKMIFGPRAYTSNDLAEAICHWVPECVVEMVTCGSTMLWVASEKGDDRPVWRLLPEHTAAAEHDMEPRGEVECKLPRELVKPLKELREAFVLLSNHEAMSGFMGSRGDASRVRSFDYELFRETEMRALAKATAFSGWNARNAFHPKFGQNAFHFVFREIVFHRFKLTLRNAALAFLNECLVVVGRAMGGTLEVKVSGLPGSVEIDKAFADLDRGEMPFGDILDRLRL